MFGGMTDFVMEKKTSRCFFIDFEVRELSRSVRDPQYCFFSSPLQFNFVGKLLGPRGNSMKRLQEETGAKMSILGKGSMRDKDKVG